MGHLGEEQAGEKARGMGMISLQSLLKLPGSQLLAKQANQIIHSASALLQGHGAMMSGFEMTSTILTSCQTHSVQHFSGTLGRGGGVSKRKGHTAPCPPPCALASGPKASDWLSPVRPVSSPLIL